MEIEKASGESTRWDWIAWPLIIVLLLSFWNPGHRLPAAMRSGAFLALVCMPFLLVGMSWASLAALLRKGNGSRWRLWICLSGCVALSLALLIPLLVLFLGLPASEWFIWCLASSMVALVAAFFAPRSLGFPLFFGGLIMSGLVFLTPMGIL
jgi:hypothetical protein